MLDLAIIGGGPAGISTALHVQAAAPHLSIAVLEKARFPRDKICAGGIGARAFRLFEQIGVEVDCPCVAIDAVAMHVGGETVVVDHPRCAAVIRRFEFDHAFAQVAIDRGIIVREACEVRGLSFASDRVVIEHAGGTLEARAVVGADGVTGVTRRLAGLPRGELRAQVIELDTGASPRDLPRDTIVFDLANSDLRGYAWDFPTQVAGEPLVCRGVYALHDGKPRSSARDHLADYLAARELDIDDYRLKQFAEQGFDPETAISIPRVLLVGEAAGIDIATGEGIGQAIEFGAVAGPYLARALARDDLGFADWHAAIERHHLGFQLAIRRGCYRAFFGPRRPTIERLLPRVPKLFEVGIQDFAGAPLDPLALARGAGQFLSAIVAHKTGRQRREREST